MYNINTYFISIPKCQFCSISRRPHDQVVKVYTVLITISNFDQLFSRITQSMFVEANQQSTCRVFIVLAPRNNNLRVDMSLHSHIFLIPGQPVFALTPECYVFSKEATNTNINTMCLATKKLDTVIEYHKNYSQGNLTGLKEQLQDKAEN